MTSAVTAADLPLPCGMSSQLSPRQREILGLVAAGRTSKEIGIALGISESTVNWHLANAFERLGASSRAEAVALAIRSEPEGRAPAVAAGLRFDLARAGWRQLLAVAVAIAIAGALLGGATVATLHLGSPGPAQSATPAPPNRTDPLPQASAAPVPASPTNLLPAPSTPPLPVPQLPVPSAPVTVPPLPTVPLPTLLPLPTVPIPLPTVPLP